MKTCLYQPIFINPQAYFVFPSLYHIEKGDSFIEPANITGQLIINTLTDDPTLTPIILTVKDNNQVDFSIFAGKHIRISQYTDEGAVVLGEWLMPGESAPVYPDWFTSSVKAIYDPASQGMTNYDVIEAYAEDFTTWILDNNSADITVTNNKLIITETKIERSEIIRNSNANEDLILYVTGIDNTVRICYYNGTAITAIHNGLNKIHTDKNYIDFRSCVDIGTCNITITQLPTSILKDLSGNGNHAYLYGGKGKLNSGMGVYKEDFTTWSKIQGIYELGANSFNWKYSNDTNTTILTKGANETKSMKVIIEGLSTNILQYAYYEESVRKILEIKQDGEYVLPFSESNSSQTWNGFAIIKNEETVDITITQVPDYPNQLCYDGTMYAVCYGFPILTDYTVMADRTWFDIRSVSCFIGKRNRSGDNLGAFEFEFRANQALSFGRTNSIIFADSGIVYQTKNSYNGIGIESGLLDDTDVLIIGAAQQNINNRPQDIYIGCHGKIIIADRSFTEEEIDWIRKIFII